MTTRMIKLLSATTAFVAATAAANAATVSIISNQTTPTVTTGANDVIHVSGSGVVISTTGPNAIVVSGTGSAVLNVGTGTTVSSGNTTSGTIAAGRNAEVADITVNNSGTIINTSENGYAIYVPSANQSSTRLVVRNTGTISGSILTTTGTLTYTGTGTGSSVRGNLTSSASTDGTDAVSLESGATITGNVSLGAGANTLTISGTGSRLNGKYTGGADADVVTLTNGAVVSATAAGAAIDLDDGANKLFAYDSTIRGTTGGIVGTDGVDVVQISNSTVAVNSGNAIALGASADVLTISNSTVTGDIDLGAGNNVANLANFTTGGTITGAYDMNVAGTVTINNTANVGNNLTLAGATDQLNVNRNLTVTGALTTNKGLVNVASATTLTAATADDYSRFGVALGTSTTMGKIALTGAASTLTHSSVTINLGNTNGFIASGTTFSLFDNTNTATVADYTKLLTTSQTGVYRFSLAAGAGAALHDIVLTVGRVSTSAVVTGQTQQALADSLDALGEDATGALITAQGLIGQQTTAAGVQNVIEQLSPNIDGVGAASVGVTGATGNQVSNRLASLRSSSALSGVATGDAVSSRHMWVEGFGNTTEQDDRNGNRGYDANAAGATFGFDTDELVEGFTTGAAFSYAKGSVDSNASGGASTDIDSYIGTLYGSRVLDNGMFVNGQASLGLNNYDSSRVISGLGTATADFDGWQGSLKGEVGKDFGYDAVTLTPLASLQYTYLDMDKYTETGVGNASLAVNPEAMSSLDAGLGGQVAYTMQMANGGTFKPNAHAKYIYRMGDTNMETTSRFTGGGTAFTTNGVKADRSSVNLGAGLLLTTAQGVDFSLNYDADIRDSLTGHTGQLKARWAF